MRRRGVRRENKGVRGREGAAKRGLLKFRGAVGLSSLSQSLVESVSFRLAGCLCKFMPARQTCVATPSFLQQLQEPCRRHAMKQGYTHARRRRRRRRRRDRIMMRIIGNKWK